MLEQRRGKMLGHTGGRLGVGTLLKPNHGQLCNGLSHGDSVKQKTMYSIVGAADKIEV